MQKIYKAVIVGGGAAGLMAAVELTSGVNAIAGEDLLVLERNDRVGKKLLATGNGQANLTNENLEAKNYYGESGFINAFIEKAKQIDIRKYLNNLGIPTCASKDGKVYPLSRQASAVLDIIRAYLKFKNCQIQTDCKVTKVESCDFGYRIIYDGGSCLAKNVVFATGGAAGKQFGTDGTAYALMESFGHKKTELYPSLVQLKTETALIRGLKGLKETATVTAFKDGRPIKSATGDILFTEYGVSGSSVFQISACVAGVKDAYIIVEFLPELTFSETEKIILAREKKPYFKPEELLCGILNKKIGQAVIKAASNHTAKAIAYTIKNFKLKVTGTLDFNYAQVTKGGIKTDKINSETMESKLDKGLYIVGEALDVDGDCGGYNLTFAFVSAITAARAIKNTNK